MAKRFVTSSVNWASIVEKLPPVRKSEFIPLRISHDKYLKEIATRPAELPKIDWSSYKSKTSTPAAVDALQKSYEALKVPYPSDQGMLAKTEKINSDMMSDTEKIMQRVNSDKAELQAELQKLESIMRYADMTMEEFYLARPDLKIDPDNPKFWPHLVIESHLGPGSSTAEFVKREVPSDHDH